MKDLFNLEITSGQMTQYGFSLNVNENWLDLELPTDWKKSVVIIKYNNQPVVSEKLGFATSSLELEFDVIENDCNVRYYVEMVSVGDGWGFYVTRNGFPLLVTSRDRKTVTKQSTVATRVICYEVRSRDDLVELPIGAANISSSGVYCIVDYDRKTIYLWNGREAGFQRKLAGDGAALILRKRFGHDFKIRDIEEGSEPTILENLFKQ